MGRPSIIKQLPDEVRREINSRLVEERFSSYTRLASEFTAKGYPISKTALHRYGQEFECSLQRAREVERLRDAGVDLTVAAALVNNAGIPHS